MSTVVPPDNRTGRRTRRSVGPSDPGPPVRRSQPADLMALMANYNPHAQRREAFPPLSMLKLVPVVTVASVQTPPRSTLSPLGKYLDSLKNEFQWDVNPNRSNYLRWYYHQDNQDHTTGHNLLQCYACDKCGQLEYKNMFTCLNAGHVLCRSCSDGIRATDNFNHYLGKCVLCKAKNIVGFRSMSSMAWSLIQKVPLQCTFKDVGCLDRIYESNYGDHTACCPVGWHCFLCSKTIRADQIEGHFCTREGENVGHGPMTYLVPRGPRVNDGGSQGNAKLEFDVRIPYMSPFGVCRFYIQGLGAYVLYQLQLDEYEMIWILVQNGTNPEDANKVNVHIALTATSIARSERGVYSYKWINRIYPWKTRVIATIHDVMRDDEYLTKVAKFNFKTMAESKGQKSFRCNLSLEVKEVIETESKPTCFELVDPNPPIDELEKLNL